MVQFDNQYRQVKLKVVYYGPGLCGKTTCLQYIHRVTDPQRRTKLYALNTATDRTLFFDLLALDLGRVRGYRLTLQLYTVPGQVQYNATRRAVLAGADGVVFVADSQRQMARSDQDSLANLGDNLKANGLDPATMPTILQYNKRDLPDVLSRAELDAAINPRGLPVFETVAISGIGVIEGFAAITEATVVSVADRLGLSSQPDALARLVANVRTALQPMMRRTGQPAVDGPVVVRPAVNSESFGQDELIGEAVRANLAMTDLNSRLDTVSRELETRLQAMHSINEFGRVMSLAREPEEVTTSLLDRMLSELHVGCGSLLLVDGKGDLVEVLRRGLAADPLTRRDETGASPADGLLSSRQPFIVRVEDLDGSQADSSAWMDELRALALQSALAVPLVAQDRPIGLITAYADGSRRPFDDAELELATALAGNAGVALANARAWRSLEQVNSSLEDTVAQRTRELQDALQRARTLAGQLEDRNLELEGANHQLRELERLKGDLLNRIAHELNTPVTAIGTAARILSRYDEVPRDKAVKFLEIITQESARLADLIASALQAVVLGVADGAMPAEQVPVAELLKRALAPFKTEIGARAIDLHVKVASGLNHVSGDGNQLDAALRAVIKNAVEFNRPGGAITVTVRPIRRGTKGFVEFRVEDTGLGIPAADLPHVSEVFWQGGNVLTEKPRGLGLGLAVARRVAENHGGMFEVASDEGKGTNAAILIPVEAAGQP